MRTMKDKERLMLVIKVFLDLNGPATAREITNYIERCPVRFETVLSPIKIGALLRGHKTIRKTDKTSHKPRKYFIEG